MLRRFDRLQPGCTLVQLIKIYSKDNVGPIKATEIPQINIFTVA